MRLGDSMYGQELEQNVRIPTTTEEGKEKKKRMTSYSFEGRNREKGKRYGSYVSTNLISNLSSF